MPNVIKYDQGGSMDMPLPESIRGDKRFQSMNPRYIGKLGDKFDGDADSGYAAGDLRFFSFNDDGFFVVDKDDNVWSTEKWYTKEGETGPYYEDGEFSMDDYVKENYGAEKFMIEGQSYIGLPEKKMASEATGGMGASATEDLLERLNQYKRNAYGNKYEQGGMVAKKRGSTIKIAGQYAVDSIKTTPEGNQYVSMELPDGKVVPVFGDWETYGNPDRERRIEDLDYVIYPLGDGTYALDAAEAEAEMLRDEARGVARDADNTEDLLQELNQRSSMRGMRPVRRQ